MDDIWFDRYVDSLNELEAAYGVRGSAAQTLASILADKQTAEHFADLADIAKDREKE